MKAKITAALSLVIMILLLVVFSSCGVKEAQREYIPLPSVTEAQFLDTLQYYSFLYFVNEINEETGLVKDRSADWSPSSIAATGFGVAAWIVGAERGWIPREQAVRYVSNLVRFLLASDHRGDTNSTGYKGFYYHFLKMNDGRREWKSELSSIDTGLLLAGLITAYEYFDRKTDEEKYIRESVIAIKERIEWDWMLMQKDYTQYPDHVGSLSMGWTPESGFHNMGWIGYNEAMILYVMAAGGDFKNAESAYKIWLSTYKWQEPYKGLQHFVFPPLFGHHYSHMFLDTKGLYDARTSEMNIDYFENTRRATLTQRLYCIENPHKWEGYDSLTWGITACDGPGETYNRDGRKYLGYAGRGTSGPEYNYFDDGTIAPTAAGGSVPYAPEICVPALYNMFTKYGPQGLWSKYGLKDAFNLTAGWIGPDYIGIDQGPIVIQIENYKSGLIWKYFMKNKYVRDGLKRLGFVKR
ncbi:MAG: Tat pathway signal protein [Ignavibacteriaceae bacterium]|nr:Tat pathway signal protein [Ignavibacteriaceae bacterium]